VPETGHKDELPGNVLVIKLAPDGRLSGEFEGADGLRFRLLKR